LRQDTRGHRAVHSLLEPDPGLRRKLIDEAGAQGASYTDPLGEAVGHDAMDAAIAGVQQQFPGSSFTLLGPEDRHHRQAWFTWASPPAARSRWSSVSTSPWPAMTAG
jgi:hypothetical protein